jgi:hypothetical protein
MNSGPLSRKARTVLKCSNQAYLASNSCESPLMVVRMEAKPRSLLAPCTLLSARFPVLLPPYRTGWQCSMQGFCYACLCRRYLARLVILGAVLRPFTRPSVLAAQRRECCKNNLTGSVVLSESLKLWGG